MDLKDLLKQIADNIISNNAAKQVFDEMWASVEFQPDGTRRITTDTSSSIQFSSRADMVKIDVNAIIEAKGLKQMSDTGELEGIIDSHESHQRQRQPSAGE